MTSDLGRDTMSRPQARGPQPGSHARKDSALDRYLAWYWKAVFRQWGLQSVIVGLIAVGSAAGAAFLVRARPWEAVAWAAFAVLLGFYSRWLWRNRRRRDRAGRMP
ncbi:MAG: hypothetical protein QM741_09465 [Rudaea sp.]|uniref:hypothetical protein n=1 Tax=Rudaea sp. TaxID=2136325 RepID=UPI0039E67296